MPTLREMNANHLIDCACIPCNRYTKHVWHNMDNEGAPCKNCDLTPGQHVGGWFFGKDKTEYAGGACSVEHLAKQGIACIPFDYDSTNVLLSKWATNYVYKPEVKQ